MKAMDDRKLRELTIEYHSLRMMLMHVEMVLDHWTPLDVKIAKTLLHQKREELKKLRTTLGYEDAKDTHRSQ